MYWWGWTPKHALRSGREPSTRWPSCRSLLTTPASCSALNHLGLPDFLEEFLQNDVLKIGLSLKDDFAMLRRRNQKDPRMGNWVELQDYVASFGIEKRA